MAEQLCIRTPLIKQWVISNTIQLFFQRQNKHDEDKLLCILILSMIFFCFVISDSNMQQLKHISIIINSKNKKLTIFSKLGKKNFD